MVLRHENERPVVTPPHVAAKGDRQGRSAALQEPRAHLGHSSEPQRAGMEAGAAVAAGEKRFSCLRVGSRRKANRNSHYDIFKNKSPIYNQPPPKKKNKKGKERSPYIIGRIDNAVPGLDTITNEKNGAAAEEIRESHDSRKTKTGAGSAVVHTRPRCRICSPEGQYLAVPQTGRKGIRGKKNPKVASQRGGRTVPAERPEACGRGEGCGAAAAGGAGTPLPERGLCARGVSFIFVVVWGGLL